VQDEKAITPARQAANINLICHIGFPPWNSEDKDNAKRIAGRQRRHGARFAYLPIAHLPVFSAFPTPYVTTSLFFLIVCATNTPAIGKIARITNVS